MNGAVSIGELLTHMREESERVMRNRGFAYAWAMPEKVGYLEVQEFCQSMGWLEMSINSHLDDLVESPGNAAFCDWAASAFHVGTNKEEVVALLKIRFGDA